ncbi:hypothetical protein [Kitasatospora sp. NPDC088783]|uniref:hypothetical protein n=1 Tax=Kitasatospora sp. NPDC088783 TaxID=3364077 RepID=UPI00381D07D2
MITETTGSAAHEMRLHPALAVPASVFFLAYAVIAGILLVHATRTALPGLGENALFIGGLPVVLAGATDVLSQLHFVPILWTRIGLAVCLSGIAAMVARSGDVLSFDGILLTATLPLVETGTFITPLIAALAIWRAALLHAWYARGHRAA